MKKLGVRYEQAVREDSLTALGTSIHIHRNIRELIANRMDKMSKKDIIDTADLAYQHALDMIIDGIVDCCEMKMESKMAAGLRESMLIKRGFKKKKTNAKQAK